VTYATFFATRDPLGGLRLEGGSKMNRLGKARGRLAGLSVVAVASAAALFVGASAYPSSACAAVGSAAQSDPAAIAVNGKCGQPDPIYSFEDDPDPGEKLPKQKLSVENTGTKCDLVVRYLVGHTWKVAAVAPGAKLEKKKRFREILVFCKAARPDDPARRTSRWASC
jgi:hypothetical protein